MKKFSSDKNFTKDEFVRHYDKIASPVSQEIQKELSTENVTVVAAFVGSDGTPLAGVLRGLAELKNPIIVEGKFRSGKKFEVETNLIKFCYTIYNPPFVTNNMQTITPYFLPEYNDNIEDTKEYFKHIRELDEARLQTERISWGPKGFWLYTPAKTLTGDDLDCRIFIRQVQSVSRKYNWAGKIKKKQELCFVEKTADIDNDIERL